MINNSETSNVKLTDEHTKEIEQYQVKLSNLLSEIVNATKILKGTTLESNRAVKDRTYQQDLLATLTPQIQTAQKNLDDLTTRHSETTTKLGLLNTEIAIKTTEYNLKESELKDREAKISQKEKQLSEQGEKLGRETILFNNDKATHNAKVAKLKEVIKDF
jgi:uncharacterized protein (DUF3084 family)